MIALKDDTPKLNVSDETTPLGVFLVKSDSNEEKLLFRYPYEIEQSCPLSQQVHSKYALGDRPLQSATLPRHGLEALREQNTGLTPLLPAYTELTSSLSVDLSRDQNEITK